MAHQIDTTVRSEGALFVVRTPAWHRLGRVLENAPTSRDAIREAGLDWTVEQQKVYTEGPEVVDEDGISRPQIAIPNMLANVRSDTRTVLATVSQAYSVVQNADAFDFLDSLVGLQDGVHYIAPLCAACNARTDAFQLKSGVALVPAGQLAGCGA